MEIVEAQDVRNVKFDPDTGKPLEDQNLNSGGTSAPAGGLPSMAPPTLPTSTSTTPTSSGGDNPLDDFPVNFN
jgi:hypothetical protein